MSKLRHTFLLGLAFCSSDQSTLQKLPPFVSHIFIVQEGGGAERTEGGQTALYHHGGLSLCPFV